MATFNRDIIEVLRTIPERGAPGALKLPVALWPNNVALQTMTDDELGVVASRTGFLACRWGWARSMPAVVTKLAWLCRINHARLWIVMSPWDRLYERAIENNAQLVTHEDRAYWFRAGDPRTWITGLHDVWIANAIMEARAMAALVGDLGLVIHLDNEAWDATDTWSYDDLPPEFCEAVRTKTWLVAQLLRQYLPGAVQEWNDNGGWRDTGSRGWQRSSQYPRPVEAMPGDVVHQTMFSPGDPHYWEALGDKLWVNRSDQPWVWNISLGVTAGPINAPHYPGPLGQSYNVGGESYHPGRSWLLGHVLGGFKRGPRWDWTKRLSWLSIESDVFHPSMDALAKPYTMRKHFLAFTDGLRGRPMVEAVVERIEE